MVPALITIIFGGVIVALIFLSRPPLFIIAALSFILLAVTVYYHINFYSIDYRKMNMGDAFKSLMPVVIIGFVIVMCIGYLFMMVGGRSSVPRFRPSSIYGRPVPGSSYGQRQKPGLLSGLFGTSTSSYDRRSSDESNSERREYISALDRLI
jgi:amino acid transporter